MSTTPAPLPPWHDLLAAVNETLDVPLPENYDDTPTYHRLLAARVNMLRGYLRGMVDELHEPDIHADGIRRMKQSTPVTYPPVSSPQDEPAEASR
ncbi:hypothetical protein [Streptomyces sp. DH8]|uniref:hypothetical protein n=1 Tax=Streptomyces sp. DH8 TaxID=2857008 RepID=UPI001E2B4070|nr:hypothetical protein [Streptomyces sp. DH8]